MPGPGVGCMSGPGVGCLPCPGVGCLPGPGVSAWSGGGLPGPGAMASQHALIQTPSPPTCGQTHTCKNITLATTSLRLVKSGEIGI